MTQFRISLTPDQETTLRQYAAHHGIKSRRAALHKLIGESLAAFVNDPTLTIQPDAWGGWRGNSNSLKGLRNSPKSDSDKG